MTKAMVDTAILDMPLHVSEQLAIEDFSTRTRRTPRMVRWSFAIGLAILGLISRNVFVRFWGLDSPFVTFYPAVLLASAFGGLDAGLIAIAASALFAAYFFFEPTHTLRIADRGEVTAVALFVAVATLIDIFVDVLVRTREAARREKNEAIALRLTAEGARREAELANSTKDKFLAMVSHELRSPLTAILGAVHLLKTSDSQTDLKRLLDMIERNAKTETRLVEDLLDLSRFSTGKMALNRQLSHLRPIVDAVVVSMKPALAAKNLFLLWPKEGADPAIFVDPQRMQQIVSNLLSNACKFTPAGGWIRVDVKLAADSYVELSVSDSGIGMDQALKASIFEPFRQGQASQYGGLGLGLAIVKGLVELHEGTIEVHSEGPGMGTTFVVHLPLSQSLQ